jgi:hypothetical protein
VEVDEIRSRLQSVIGALDPDGMLAGDAARLIETLAGIGRLADAGITLLADRVQRAGTWDRRRHPSMLEWLAAQLGTSRAEALDRVKTSERVTRLPSTTRRVRQGRLSSRQTREVADAASANPAAEDRLLDTAEAASLGELRDAAQRARAAADRDPDATQARLHRQRRVRQRRDAEGAWCLEARGPISAGSQVMAVLRAEQDRVFRAARAAGRHEPQEAYLFDALVNVITGTTATPALPPAPAGNDASDDRNDGQGGEADPPGTLPGLAPTQAAPGPAPASAPGRARSSGSDSKVIVRVDLPALLRGHTLDGEVCEIAGAGPVAPSVVRQWIDEGAFLAAVVTHGVDVVTVAHLGRRFTAAQRSAMQWIAPTCARLGCNHSIHLDYDHRTNWADTLRSLPSDADRLCRADHDLKTHHGWALVPGTGKRPMVPPDDPRHPRAGPPGTTAPNDPDRADPAGAGHCRTPQQQHATLTRLRQRLIAETHAAAAPGPDP